MAVGSERGTTHLDVLAVDQIICGGTIAGSVVNTGTQTTTQENFINIGVSGSVTASKMTVGTLSYDVAGDVGVTGTVTGTYIVGSQIYGALITGSSANVKGTVTGTSFYGSTAYFADLYGSKVSVLGTVLGTGLIGSNVLAAHVTASKMTVPGTVAAGFTTGTLAGAMKCYNSGLQAVTTTAATIAHGLGVAPSAVIMTPAFDFGTFSHPFLATQSDATNLYIKAGTMGTVYVSAFV